MQERREEIQGSPDQRHKLLLRLPVSQRDAPSSRKGLKYWVHKWMDNGMNMKHYIEGEACHKEHRCVIPAYL